MRTTMILCLCSVLTTVFIGCKPAEEKTERYQGPPEQYIRATLGAGENAKATLGIIAIHKAIDMFQLQNGRFPSSLAEVKKEGFLPQVPEAPIGKKFSYESGTGKVTVIDK